MSSDVSARNRLPLVTSDHVAVHPRTLDTPPALLSIDVETDFGTGRTDALAELPRFLDFVGERQLPLTAFVEGQLFERHPHLCAHLVKHGVDVQLEAGNPRALQGLIVDSRLLDRPGKVADLAPAARWRVSDVDTGRSRTVPGTRLAGDGIAGSLPRGGAGAREIARAETS